MLQFLTFQSSKRESKKNLLICSMEFNFYTNITIVIVIEEGKKVMFEKQMGS